ncbi:MAG: hypothetical protein U0002_13505 [Thermoanaerobaculia bacterium]
MSDPEPRLEMERTRRDAEEAARGLLLTGVGIEAVIFSDRAIEQELASAVSSAGAAERLYNLRYLMDDVLTAVSSLEAVYSVAQPTTKDSSADFHEAVIHSEEGLVAYLSSPSMSVLLLALLAPEANVGSCVTELRSAMRNLATKPS